MGLKLEVGKYYKTRDGQKVGPMYDNWNGVGPFFWHAYTGAYSDTLWDEYGQNGLGDQAPSTLIAEWTDAPTGPVRTVTRTTREIVPGEYDGLDVGRAVNGTVFLAMPIANHCQESIDAIIANLTVIRDALEDV